MKKILLFSSISAVVVFAVSYVIFYRSLLLQQPKNGVFPENFTSNPPSSAWLPALPYAIVVFILVFLIMWLLSRK